MKIILAFLLVIFLVFSGYHLSFQKFRIPLFARKFYLTGMEFLFLGLLLGPHFLNILDCETCHGLAPLSALVLGWIGMLFGFQFEIAKLRRFPLYFFSAAVLESAVTLVIVFVGGYLMLPVFFDLDDPVRVVIALALAGAAACTAQTALSLFSLRGTDSRQPTIKFLRYLSSIDGLVAMLVLLPVYIYFSGTGTLARKSVIFGADTVTAILSFVGLIVLFNLFLARRKEERELAMIAIGMTVFTSGFAMVINFSPLIANFFVGASMVNITREKEKLYNTFVSIEKPLYLLLLVFLGSAWHFAGFWILAAGAGYCGLRFAGKVIGGAAISSLCRGIEKYPVTIGLGLIEQGGLALAILYDFYQAFQSDVTATVVGIALLAVVANDLLSPAMLAAVLRRNA